MKFLEYVNSKKGYKVAIDIPSGLNATTGQIMNAVFRADLTVTMGNYKTGLFFCEGRKVSGEVKPWTLVWRNEDIGISRIVFLCATGSSSEKPRIWR